MTKKSRNPVSQGKSYAVNSHIQVKEGVSVFPKALCGSPCFKELISFLFVILTTCLVCAGEIYNLGAKLRAENDNTSNGWPFGSIATQGDFSGLSGGRLFDGNTYQASSSPSDTRWMVSIYKHGGPGSVYAQLGASEAFRPNKNFILRKYRLFRGSYWRQDNRDPTQWKIYGIPDGATSDPNRWVLLDERTTDYAWPSFQANETNEFPVVATGEALVGFRAFRFVPTSSLFYAQSVKDGKSANDYDLDMREIEFDVEEVEAPPRVPMRIVDFFKDRGSSLKGYYKSQNMYANYDNCTSFDGLRSSTDNNGTYRCLGYMGLEGGVFVELNLADAPELPEGDTFYLSDYRIYTLFNNGNEKARAPTTWMLQTEINGTGLVTTDSHSDVNWNDIDFTKWGVSYNFLQFRLNSAVPFEHVRFVPTDSYAKSVEGKTGNTLNVGWMEIDLFVSTANEKGTLRVKTNRSGCSGFTPASESIVTEESTLCAPAKVRIGNEMYAVNGYYLEYFDFSTGHWQYKPGSYSTTLSYSFVPDSDKAERLVWMVSDEPSGFNVSIDPSALIGKERVDGQGFYDVGDMVTLTAYGSDDNLILESSSTNLFHSTFVRWEGDLSGIDIDPSRPQISYTMDRLRDLRPVFARDWLLFSYDKANEGGSGTENRIKNGVWEFRVNNPIADSHKLTILSYGYCRGAGKLDFSEGRIYKPGDAQTYVIRAMEDFVMGITASTPVAEREIITSLVLPSELEDLGQSSFRSEESLTNLVMNCPFLKNITYCQFTRDINLRHVELNLPNVVSIDSNWAFFNVPLTETDASTWDLSSVTNVGSQTFAADDLSRMREYSAGRLELPALVSVDKQAFQGCLAFGEIWIGTACKTLSRIVESAFDGASVTNLVLGSTSALSVGENAFRNVNRKNGLRCLTFTGVAPSDRTVVDRILQMNDLSKSGCEATLSVPLARVSSWGKYITPTENIADEIMKATAVKHGADGVWISADGTYKAYVKYFGPQASGMILLIH